MSSFALPLRVYEFWLVQYRRAWRGTVITSVINPVFYLGALDSWLAVFTLPVVVQIGRAHV